MTVTYRDAQPGDGATLDRLFNESFCDTFAHLYRPEDLEEFLTSFGVEDWEEQLRDPVFACRIAEVDGEAAAYVKIGPLKIPVEEDSPALLLDQLYVLKPYHGAGIAQQLIDWTFEEARRRGATRLYLTVYVDNHRARRFYDRHGFEAVGRYDFMVGSHADEDVIMRKVL
jgi:GNAT superfamily N-acetyltransferase